MTDARLLYVTIDAVDAERTAAFWAALLGTEIDDWIDDGRFAFLGGREDLPVVCIQRVPEPKQGKNRIHLDLASRTNADQRASVDRLLGSGAQHADIGQADVSWVVLTDPEGNECCVLAPETRFDEPGTLSAIVLDAVDPGRLARFWAQASGWQIRAESHLVATLCHPTGRPPALDIVAVPDPTPGKNRVHLDVAPGVDEDQRAEVDRLIGAGARRADVGQGDDVTWVVLADPEGNEFCVLSPR